MAPDPAEAGNILFNQISVKQANLQRLVDSWLPPQASEDVQAATSDDNLENEEQGLFTPMPETAGVGFTLPKDGEIRREELSSNDKLRKQLLGKDYEKHKKSVGIKPGVPGVPGVAMPVGSNKYKPTPFKRTIEDDSEDDVGRSSLGKPKPKKRREYSPEEAVINNSEPAVNTSDGKANSPPRRKNKNYLDEVLAEKTEKKRKKGKKKHKHVSNGHE